MAAGTVVLMVADPGEAARWTLAALAFALAAWFGARALDPLFGSALGNLVDGGCCLAMAAMLAVPLLATSSPMSAMAGMGAAPGIAGVLGTVAMALMVALMVSRVGVAAARTQHARRRAGVDTVA